MDCPNCGHRNPAGSRYCEQCGTALTTEHGNPATTAASAAPNPPAGTRTWLAAPPGQESRTWAIGAHLSALAGGFLGGLPAFLGPLVVWLVRKDADPYAAAHGRAALNFNLSVLLYAVALVVLSIITFGVGLLVAIPAGAVLGIGWLVFSVIGAIKAANDEVYRYPLTIQFVK